MIAFIARLFNLFGLISMGNNNSDLTQAQFKQQWRIVHTINGRNVWENKQNPSEKLEEHNIRDDQIQNNTKLCNLRKRHPFIVNANSVKKQGFSCQMDHAAKKIFVEHTPVRLSSLNRKISYPDIFHLYDIFIHGYAELANVVGFFNVDIDQVGINERGAAKVWLSRNFESNVLTGTKVSQAKMVGDILNVLESITDHASAGKCPNIANYFKQQPVSTFPQLTTLFRQYINDHEGGEVPTRLSFFNSAKIQQSVRASVQQVDLTKRISQNKVVQETTYVTKTQQQPYFMNGQPKTESSFISTPLVENKVVQPYPAKVYIPQVTQPVVKTELVSSVTNPLVSETFIGGPAVVPASTTTNRPTTSINLVRTNSQDMNQFKVRATTLNPQIRFGHSNNVVVIPQSVQQQNQTSVIQRPFYQQNAIQYPPQNVQVPTQAITSTQPQGAILANTSPIIQPSILQTVQQTRTFPLQVSATENILDNLKGVPVTQNKGDFVTTTYPSSYGQNENRLQQQRVISQTYEVSNGTKVAESEVQNVAAGTSNNKANVLKGSETIAWQDYTNKNDTGKGLSNFGRAVPQSFDIAVEKKTQPQSNTTKFTPESDGKSSAEFLALLSQIKSGIGQTSSTQSYSYSTSKNESVQGSYNTNANYETSKYSSNNYVSSNYQGGLDPQLHADLQKYRQ